MEIRKPLGIEVDYSDTLNYAMVLNGIPFIRKITIMNQTENEMEQIEVIVRFQEDIAKDFSRTIDVMPPGLQVDLGEIPMELNPEYLFHLTEAMTTQLTITIQREGEELAEETREVHVLAYNEWQGMDTMPEVLAAFVTPNHPAIDNILVEASHILKESGKDPSFEGYQSGDVNRVREQVHAVFTALRNQQITYIGPPASFVARGQRIRLSSEVLEKKMGTCLDLTLLFASCLEAVSIHPLIVLIKGHSFLGYWQEEEFFQDTVEYDVSSLTKRSAEGMSIIGVLETTDIRSGQNFTFTQSEENAKNHLLREEDFIMTIDVKRARAGGITPLPERLLVDGQYVKVREQNLEERTKRLPELKEVVKVVQETTEKTVDRKTLWERKLLDLSLRNNLLNYVPGRKGIELLVKDQRALEDILYEGKEFQLLPRVSDHEKREGQGPGKAAEYFSVYGELLEGEFQQRKLRTLLDGENLEKKLTRMYRDARIHLEESGANSLFLTMGVLKWYENSRSTRERFAPLLLIPVEMKKKVGKNAYSISAREEDTLVNITLLEKLKQDFGLEIQGLSELPLDEKGVDVMKVMSIARNAVLSQKRWDVLDEVHLGLFSFSKFIMWNDIRNHGEELRRNKVIQSLMEGKLAFDAEKILRDQIMLDEVISPSEILLPVSTDASQLQAVDAAVKGRSFVLHGPPGTGKSQTITTIIANALYQGKRVLFVAEKMAALSVVQRRLEGLGLGHFSLEVHSNKSKKTHILKKLEETTKMVSKGEVDFKAEAEKLKKLRGELNEVVAALYRTYGFDRNAYELMGKLEYLENAPEIEGLKIRYEDLDKTRIEELFLLGRELTSIAQEVGEYADAPLKGIGITAYTFDLKSQVEKEISALRGKAEKLGSITDALMKELSLSDISQKRKLDSLHALMKKLKETTLFRELLFHEQGYRMEKLHHAVLLTEKKENLEEALLREYEPSLFLLNEKDLRDTLLQAEEKFIFFRGMTRKKVTRVLSAQRRGKDVTEEEALTLLNQMEEKKKLESEIEEALRGFPVPETKIPSPEKKTSSLLRSIMKEMEEFRTLFRLFDPKGEERAPAVFKEVPMETAKQFLDTYEDFEKDFSRMKEKLSLQVESLPELEGNWAYRLFDRLTTYSYNLEELREWTAYNRLVEKSERNKLTPMIKAFENGSLSGKEAEDALKKTLYKGAFLYILSEEPLLQKVTGRQYKEKIAYFKEVTAKYEDLAKREIQHVLASRVPNMMKEANGSSEVGILQRAIRSGGRGMTLRTLFDRLPNLLPRITPCMLMSPLSVAQYLGTSREYFDLVIFDEASQMPTAESVGAMARGKEVVIVGDPKQLPPTTFFSTASGKLEEEDGVMEDLDNILEDALALSMPETSLLWHYRSRHESLIAYSNRTYYDNDLYTYPSPGELKSKVSYQYVDATYGRGGTRANRKEAEAVVSEIMERLKDEKRREDSIGVVTFSMAQKDMIEDTLSEALKAYPEIEERILAMEEPVFVKNLENVQGDERDVILFSIGYGPDEEGKITLNFGPLNRENGWKRLNVAITRSKKEMKIFTSIRPEMMDTSRTSSQGIHDLKGFLEYARRGSQPVDLVEVKSRARKDTFADAIRKELAARGLKTDIRVGASKYKVDLAVVDEEHPEQYLLGILCQGESYRNAKSARDRDILQEMVLEGLGWHLMKVYPMDWMENREREVEKILEKVGEIRSGNLKREDSEKKEDLKTGNLIHQDAHHEESASLEDGISRSYVEAKFEHRPMSAEEFRMPKNTRDIKDALMKIIHVEAPISLNLLYRQTLKAFGVRYTQKSVDTIDSILSGLGYEIAEKDGQYYIYGEVKDAGVTFYRYATREMKREAADIPPEEIQLAVKDVVEKQVSIPEDSLIAEVLKIFGYARGNEELEERARKILRKTSDDPILKEENGNFISRI
ncbi:DUF4011 domain-containing protein [Proteiniclasticum sp. C24MP]|uniref:DUF4011 domain-containing protein n=1 Tax=Proteiniclasticum sp. C24MP TaxID=3374101 RepID=UPI0037543A89